jgi:acyl-CoA dehydrogenase
VTAAPPSGGPGRHGRAGRGASCDDASPRPPFGPAHECFRRDVRQFVETELRPHAARWESEHWFSNDVFPALARRGYLGLKYPRHLGGGPVSGDGYEVEGYLADAVFTEEIARCGSGGLASGIGAHIGIATPPVWTFGTERQKQRYLAPAARGEKIGALAITEPDAGSDVAAIRTHARRTEDGFVVNGAKMFITNGVRADFLVTAVKTRPEGGHGGLSFLIIDRGPGVRSSAIEKLGWHASDTALIALEDVFVAEENLLGDEDRGFYLIMANFQWERLLMALGALGAMDAALQRTLPVARRMAARRTETQALRHALAEMATTLEAGRALTYRALALFVDGHDAVREVTMAKLATQRACFDVLDGCLQIHYDAFGDADETQTAELERGVRDARLGPIGGGTDEIMKEILGRSLGL